MMARMPTGRLRKNAQRQDRFVVSQPPSSGPMAAIPPITAPQIPKAIARSRPRKLSLRIDCVAGRIIAPPRPWTSRAPMSISPLLATPATMEASTNRTRPPRYNARRPRTSPIRPSVTRSAAKTRV
jgi:hypothetical protein